MPGPSAMQWLQVAIMALAVDQPQPLQGWLLSGMATDVGRRAELVCFTSGARSSVSGDARPTVDSRRRCGASARPSGYERGDLATC